MRPIAIPRHVCDWCDSLAQMRFFDNSLFSLFLYIRKIANRSSETHHGRNEKFSPKFRHYLAFPAMHKTHYFRNVGSETRMFGKSSLVQKSSPFIAHLCDAGQEKWRIVHKNTTPAKLPVRFLLTSCDRSHSSLISLRACAINHPSKLTESA